MAEFLMEHREKQIMLIQINFPSLPATHNFLLESCKWLTPKQRGKSVKAEQKYCLKRWQICKAEICGDSN